MPSLTQFRLTAATAQKRVRALAADSRNVILTTHARARMQERGIDARDVHTILRSGFVDDQPERNALGAWVCKVTRRLPSSGRTAGVIAVVAADDMLIVVTVEWEDGR